MALNEQADRVRQRIQANPDYVGNNKDKILERMKKAFEEAKLEPKEEQLRKLRMLLRIIENTQLASGRSSEDVTAHRTRIDISFTIASLTMGTPSHLQAALELRSFAKQSFEQLFKADPQEALFLAKLPLSKVAQTKNLKENLVFTDWGIIGVNRVSRLEAVVGNTSLIMFANQAHKDLCKQKNRIIEERKTIQKNTAGA